MLFAGNCSCKIPVNRGESIAWRPHACFALSASQAADDGCHFGPVADDMGAIRDALAEAGVDPLSGQFLISWTHRATV